jgi:hypothetical protein
LQLLAVLTPFISWLLLLAVNLYISEQAGRLLLPTNKVLPGNSGQASLWHVDPAADAGATGPA